MIDKSFKLSEQEHEAIFKDLKKEMLVTSTPCANPTIEILGGQPGSGKSNLINIARKTVLSASSMPAIINGNE